ncbi:nucleoside hydrolase [Hyalangium versicolor]|uniref:nucleoside hydrolase n=1 Tax=Hyalangium versicolor TaxID=2861190 RepID=UPI001CCBBCDB|nr:nucleoside hydrolase [Hyalangium versicolor]
MNNRKQVLIDTDVDIDDWMAILYLMKHPDVDVVGITTTGCGAAHLTPGKVNAKNLLMLTSRPETPVAGGTSAPLIYSNQFPNSIRDGIDTLFGLSLPPNPHPIDPRPAVQFLRETLLAATTPVTVLAIGGMTNLGKLLRDHPEVKPKIDRIVVMGGAISVPGNVYDVDSNYLNKVAEWNIFLDVLGAQIVFRSGVPITLVPLDASQNVPLDKAFYNRFAQRHTSRAANFIHDALTADISFVMSGNFFFWDPLAAAILVDPSLASSTSPTVSPQVMNLNVAQTLDEEQDTSGQLVQVTDGPPIDVAMWANADAFYRSFLDIINLPDEGR